MSISSPACRRVLVPTAAATVIALIGTACFFPGLPQVEIDTTVFERSGYSRFSLEGEWVITNETGQTRRAVFDAEGALVSFQLPSGQVFEPAEDDTIEVFVTSFGAFAIRIRGRTEQAGRTITLHEYEGLFEDDMVEMNGDASIVADDLSANRRCDCRETWRLVS